MRAELEAAVEELKAQIVEAVTTIHALAEQARSAIDNGFPAQAKAAADEIHSAASALKAALADAKAPVAPVAPVEAVAEVAPVAAVAEAAPVEAAPVEAPAAE
jgi:light-harvesting protein B-800-850 alpha chain